MLRFVVQASHGIEHHHSSFWPKKKSVEGSLSKYFQPGRSVGEGKREVECYQNCAEKKNPLVSFSGVSNLSIVVFVVASVTQSYMDF